MGSNPIRGTKSFHSTRALNQAIPHKDERLCTRTLRRFPQSFCELTNHPLDPLPSREGEEITLGYTPSSPVSKGCTLLYIPQEPTLGTNRESFCTELEQAMTAKENKELIKRFFDEVYNKGNLSVADELVAKDYVSHNKLEMEVLGPDGIKKAASMQREAFPDQVTVLDDVIAEGDKVVVRGHDTGTHSGKRFMGIKASGRKFNVTWIDVFRVSNGKLQEAWLEVDVEDFRHQLSGR